VAKSYLTQDFKGRSNITIEVRGWMGGGTLAVRRRGAFFDWRERERERERVLILQENAVNLR